MTTLDLAETVDSDVVNGYLRASGWRSLRSDRVRSIWSHSSGARVFVPQAPGPDMWDLLQLAVRDIARAEDRDEAEVAVDLSWSNFDRLYVRRAVQTSSLPFGAGIDLHEAVSDVIVAAARGAKEPRPFYVGRRPEPVINYLDQVRLVPPAAGSFVVRALLPLNATKRDDSPPQSPLPGFAAPEVRDVSVAILHSARAAVHAAQDVAAGASLDRWSESVNAGVSSNLCDALARLPGEESEPSSADVELSIEWTWSAPIEPLPPVTINSGIAPILNAGSDFLRGAPEEHTVRIIGLVTKLHRDTATGPGEITIRGLVEAWDVSPRSIRVHLDEPTYRWAIRAHELGAAVDLKALVRREPRRIVVIRAEDLRMLGAEG